MNQSTNQVVMLAASIAILGGLIVAIHSTPGRIAIVVAQAALAVVIGYNISKSKK